jgi:hypothetical protein
MGRYDDVDDDDYTPGSASDEPSSDEETEAPVATKEARRVVRGGWANARQTKEAASPYPQRLKPVPEGVVVKFLEDGPYTTFRQHWINEVQEGSKAFTCLDGIDPAGCPLCDGGNRPSTQFHFNVALITEDGPATLKTYNIGPTVFDQLSELHTDPRQGPLQKHYWVIKRVKNGNKWTTTPYRQRKEDLEDDGYMVPSDEDLSNLDLWDESQVRFSTRKDLLEIAAQYLDLE